LLLALTILRVHTVLDKVESTVRLFSSLAFPKLTLNLNLSFWGSH